MAKGKKSSAEDGLTVEYVPASELPERRQVYTGVKSIDSTFPFYVGSVYGFAGKPGAGKTRLMYTLAVSAIAQYGGNIVIYDYDKSFSKQLLVRIGQKFGVQDVLHRTYLPRYDLLYTVEFFKSIPAQVKYLMSSSDVRVVIIDTITVARKMLWPGREHLAEAQQYMGHVINSLKSIGGDMLVLIGIQVMQRPDQMGRIEYIGGPTLGHAVEMFMLRHHPQNEHMRTLIAYEVSYLESGLAATFTICDEGIC